MIAGPHYTTVFAITHLQAKIPLPTVKNAIKKIVVPPRDQQFTYNLPKSIGQLPVCLQADPTG